ncbi:MAG: bacterial proteasome activator family protein [Actinomycetota bacterium]|nr:bacterial proteasome activator family protein [Actinomycetota bacterium]
MTDAAEAEGGEEPREEHTAITEPGKLMRIALMLRGMQEEVRRAPTDQAGRERLAAVHERALTQLHSVLSEDLRSELETLNMPLDQDTPTESEILVAQAQLIGWLEGLFQGIQAAIFSQQAQARQQLEQMRRPELPPGTGGRPEARPQPGGTGHYL